MTISPYLIWVVVAGIVLLPCAVVLLIRETVVVPFVDWSDLK